jgi:predicted RNA-binding Zn-ribbon protein involved in translation (DUF1610 family)
VIFPNKSDRFPASGSCRFDLRPRVTSATGTVVAPDDGMSRLLSVTASMICPLCGQPVAPTADSTSVIAWYGCPRCGNEWSARIRNGQPDMPHAGDVGLYSLPYKERR